ncbi:MAG: hypothetical protein IGS39_22040 [Calothrix sp. C42_A2020_038]|nr:hypothetical protein [Calothrix sp. C42_A2020_038]
MLIFNTYSQPPKIDTQYTLFLVDAHKISTLNVKNLTSNSSKRSISQGKEIEDDSQLQSLKRQLFNQVNASWGERKTLPSDLVYKVAIRIDGEIISYEPLNEVARAQVVRTPLPNLVYTPTDTQSSVNESFGNFRVVFRKSGVLEISPWRGFRTTPDVVGVRITDPKLLNRLQRQLLTTLRQNWEGKTTAKQDLKYRVAVNRNGVVADYEPINQVAYDYFRDTPLPLIFQELHGSNVAPPKDKEPLAHFRVVFKRNGLLEITPWRKLR